MFVFIFFRHRAFKQTQAANKRKCSENTSVKSSNKQAIMASDNSQKSGKLGVANGVYIPVCLNIVSILMFLRFGSILGHIGVLGMLGGFDIYFLFLHVARLVRALCC